MQDGDNVGEVLFVAADGSDKTPQVASVKAIVDGTPGSNDMPGGLVFSTTGDGTQTISERMRIQSDGKIGIGINDVKLDTGGIHLGDDRGIGFGDGDSNRADFQIVYQSSNTRLGIICGTGSSDEDIIITTAGFVGIGGTLGTARFFVTHDATGTQAAVFKNSNASVATEVQNTFATRAGSSAYSLIKAHSNNNGCLLYTSPSPRDRG